MKTQKRGYLVTILLAAFLMIVGNTAQAGILRIFNSSENDALIKKLKEKDVLSEEDAKEIETEREEMAKKHSINISARAQFLFTYNSSEDGKGPDKNDFDVRRLRLQFDGYLYKDLDFKFEFHADRLTEVGLKDAWAGYKRFSFLRFRLGQFKTPFSRQRMTSSSKLQLIERSIVQVFYPGRDLGLEVSGKNIGNVFDYGVAILGGAGDSLKYKDTDNGNFVMLGRVAVHPLGEISFSEGDGKGTDDFRFEVAGSILFAPSQVAFGEKSSDKIFNTFSAYGVTSLEDVPLGRTLTYGGELSVRYKGFSLLGEAYYATFSPNTSEVGKIIGTRRDISSYGFFGQAGYFVIPGYLEVAGRYGQIEIDKEVASTSDIKALTGGLNYFIKKSHKLKLQLNYIREWRKASVENSHIVMLNAQVKY